MIQPIDRPLFKVATNLARANGGDPAAIYTSIGGAFRTEPSQRKSKKPEVKASPLFDVDEATFAPSWEESRPIRNEEPAVKDHDPKKGKALLKKIYGGSAPDTPRNPPPKASRDFSDLEGYSNPRIVQQRAFKRFGKDAVVYRSSTKNKKYMILNPAGKFVHFGQLPYEDETEHGDQERRRNYLNRATKIRGNWAKDPYSPNCLAIYLLWGF